MSRIDGVKIWWKAQYNFLSILEKKKKNKKRPNAS